MLWQPAPKSHFPVRMCWDPVSGTIGRWYPQSPAVLHVIMQCRIRRRGGGRMGMRGWGRQGGQWHGRC